MLKKIVYAFAFVIFFAPLAAHAQATTAERVLVLPFENTSGLKDYNWVGQSFADSLASLLDVPGLSVVSGDEREIIYQRLRIPETVIPSRATAIKIGREARATLVVLGTYRVIPASDDQNVAAIRGSARVIRVNEGRLTGAQMTDGRWATHAYDFGDALTNLQTMQGKLAYQVLYERDKALPVAQNEILTKASKVPSRAFESYVKGKMTDDPEMKSNYLRNAMIEYERANAGATYSQAAFELGELYFKQGDWAKAAEHFSMLQSKDAHYAEAAFYAALSYWRMNDPARALGSLIPLTKEAPLTSIYNNTGAISAEAARVEKSEEERKRLVEQATTFLSRAAESAPEDPAVLFNYAYALMLEGKYTEASDRLREVIKKDPRHGEALFLFAKSLERTGQNEAAAINDNEARKYFPNYAKAQVEWQKSQTLVALPVRPVLKSSFSRHDYIAEKLAEAERLQKDSEGNSAQSFLAKARDLYQAGRDDEALQELRRVLMIEPMNPEAYLLTGRIYLRRGDLEPSINQLKTAIFWDGKLIDAHILLGRIFLERGDRAMALSYARSAVQIDPNNPEAIALQRQVDLGSR